MHELQLLVQSLTRKVGEAEERYSLLQEQTDSLKGLLAAEKEQYSQKESMYKQNVGVHFIVSSARRGSYTESKPLMLQIELNFTLNTQMMLSVS